MHKDGASHRESELYRIVTVAMHPPLRPQYFEDAVALD